MKIAILTSNELRHKYFANNISRNLDNVIVISEVKGEIKTTDTSPVSEEIQKHFALRTATEQDIFKGNDFFTSPTLPIQYKKANSLEVYELLKKERPDIMIGFGCSIIKEPLLSLVPPGRFLNLHLGLSPYYRGSGTNFWPFVNNELEYVGSTIIHIDAGIDTGDIISHVIPSWSKEDNAHTIGCKVVMKSVEAFQHIIQDLENGIKIPRVKQWQPEYERYYRTADFTEIVLRKYLLNLKKGIVKNYLKQPKKS